MTEPINPYQDLPPERFWRTGVAEADPMRLPGLYVKKFDLDACNDMIATAGSCFAQHIGKALSLRGFTVIDQEPAPSFLPVQLQNTFGYGMYSARYGNIYTVRQLVQLIKECYVDWVPYDFAWPNSQGNWHDSMRPTVEPEGLGSSEEVFAHRQYHLARVREVFQKMTVFVFTLGLTEAWMHQESSTIYPMAPGILAGSYEPGKHQFVNFSYSSIVSDLHEAIELLIYHRGGRPFRTIITVSPVPLTATACERHVLLSTVHSKSILRAAAGDFSSQRADVDYFPSYEILSSPWFDEQFYMPNRRSINKAGVERAMSLFFAEHIPEPNQYISPSSEACSTAIQKDSGTEHDSHDSMDVLCDEELLEAFGKN